MDLSVGTGIGAEVMQVRRASARAHTRVGVDHDDVAVVRDRPVHYGFMSACAVDAL